jgi:hypothetical protein
MADRNSHTHALVDANAWRPKSKAWKRKSKANAKPGAEARNEALRAALAAGN